MPQDATHVILSVGGNEALGRTEILAEPTSTVAEGLIALKIQRDHFYTRYQALLDQILTSRPNLTILVCTVYNPRFADFQANPIQAQAVDNPADPSIDSKSDAKLNPREGAKPKPFQQAAEAGLLFFNDAIIQAASQRSLTVIDLRQVCTELNDFANPIEPSDQGGKKIAKVFGYALESLGTGRTDTKKAGTGISNSSTSCRLLGGGLDLS